jgi:hypothetical protein
MKKSLFVLSLCLMALLSGCIVHPYGGGRGDGYGGRHDGYDRRDNGHSHDDQRDDRGRGDRYDRR